MSQIFALLAAFQQFDNFKVKKECKTFKVSRENDQTSL